jgi:hypothetical protein
VNGEWQDITVPAHGLAFTWCQVPVIYKLDPNSSAGLTIERHSGDEESTNELSLSPETSAEVFSRSGRIRKITAVLSPDSLFAE